MNENFYVNALRDLTRTQKNFLCIVVNNYEIEDIKKTLENPKHNDDINKLILDLSDYQKEFFSKLLKTKQSKEIKKILGAKTKKPKLRLDKDQIKSYQHALESYKKVRTQFLLAETGWGKTRVALWLIKHFYKKKYKIIIIAPKMLHDQWIKGIEKMRAAKEYLIVSYGEVSRQKEENVVSVFGLEKENKYFFIFEEAQKLKNFSTKTFKNSKILINYLDTSKILYISALINDKEANWKVIYHLSLVIGNNFSISSIVHDALQNHSDKLSEKDENHLICSKLNGKILQRLWELIYRDIFVIPTSFLKLDFEAKIINGFYEIKKKKYLLYSEQAYLLLKGIYNEKTKEFNVSGNFDRIQKALRLSCLSKIPIIVNLVKDKIEKGKKVVLCIPSLDCQNLLMKKLLEFAPLLLRGAVKMRERPEIVKKFTEKNDHKVLIITPQVGGYGLNLNDTRGDEPIDMIIIPTYNYSDLKQNSGRTLRRDTKSDSIITFVYCINFLLEAIFVNMKRKKEVEKITCIEYNSSKCILDGEIFVEDKTKMRKIISMFE